MTEEVLESNDLWKGKDEVEIDIERNVYILREHRKDKQSEEVKTTEHIIPKENVKTLWDIIRTNCIYREQYKYKYLVRKIIEKFNFHLLESQTVEQMMESWNGGKFRNRYYFPYYYWVMKCLEAKHKIIFLGRGGCIRISEEIEL